MARGSPLRILLLLLLQLQGTLAGIDLEIRDEGLKEGGTEVARDRAKVASGQLVGPEDGSEILGHTWKGIEAVLGPGAGAQEGMHG